MQLCVMEDATFTSLQVLHSHHPQLDRRNTQWKIPAQMEYSKVKSCISKDLLSIHENHTIVPFCAENDTLQATVTRERPSQSRYQVNLHESITRTASSEARNVALSGLDIRAVCSPT